MSLNTKRVGKNAISFLPSLDPSHLELLQKQKSTGEGKIYLTKNNLNPRLFFFLSFSPLSPTSPWAGERKFNFQTEFAAVVAVPSNCPSGAGGEIFAAFFSPLFALNCKVLHHLAFVSRKRKQNLWQKARGSFFSFALWIARKRDSL